MAGQRRLSLAILGLLALIAGAMLVVQGRYDPAAWREQAGTIKSATPGQAQEFTPTGTATRTATPLPTTASTATPVPIETVTTEPTAIATLESFAETAPTVIATLESFEQPTPASPLPTYVPRATLASKDIPPDVIVVSILICLIVVAIILGLRLRL